MRTHSESIEDTEALRRQLDRLRTTPRDPTGSEILQILDGLLQIIEQRDRIWLSIAGLASTSPEPLAPDRPAPPE